MPSNHARKPAKNESAHAVQRHGADRANQSTHDKSTPAPIQEKPSYSPALLATASLNGRGNTPVQTSLLVDMQQTRGNRATQRAVQRASHESSHSAHANVGVNHDVQRFLERSSGTAPLQRSDARDGQAVQNVQATQVQRFETNEHKKMGDEGSGGATIKLSDDLTVTFGDITSMAGDFFGSVEQIRKLAATPGDGKSKPGTIDEIKYVLYVKVRKTKKESDFDPAVVKAATQRYYTLAGNNRSHFTNPLGQSSPTHEQLANAWDGSPMSNKVRDAYGRDPSKKRYITNAGNYRDNHIMAIEEAARASKEGRPIDDALLAEAFGSHFLTDAYSGGHLRTPRSAISDWWNPKVPMFWHNLKLWMSENIAKHMNDHSIAGYPLTVQILWEQSRKTVEEAVGGKGIPDLTFGDAISGAVHDMDNEEGVMAQVGAEVVKLMGDGQVLDENDRALAAGVETGKKVAAGVKVSLEEVRQAYDKGKNGQDAAAIMASLRTPDGLFKAEQLWPRALPDNDARQTTKSLNWRVASPEQLFTDPGMRKAIAHFVRGKADTLGAEIDLEPPLKGDKTLALKESVLDRLKGSEDSVIDIFRQIINYTPNSVTGELGGVGGHDSDDNALEYYKEAKKKPNGLQTLTVQARSRLLKDVLEGATLGDEETMLADLLTTNDSHVVPAIQSVGWRWLWNDVGGKNWTRIMRRAGPIFWKAQSYEAKKREVQFLADGRTNGTAQEMIVIILRTCSPAEVRKIDKEVGGWTGLSFDLTDQWQDEFDRLRK